MTGPEHYFEAEDWMRVAAVRTDDSAVAIAFQAAQVHATLALVAATIDTAEGTPNFEAWQRVTR